MKKLLSLLLAAVMLLGCAAFAEAVDYTGLWTATGMEMLGMAMNPADMGMDASVTLNADGTCELNMMGEVQIGTWAVTETGITTTDANGVVDTYTLVDGTLVVEQSGMKLIFTAGEYMPVEEPTAEPIILTKEDLVGAWAFTYGAAQGLKVPAAMMGMEMSFTLTAEGGHYEQTAQGQYLETDIVYTVTEDPAGLILTLQVVQQDGTPVDMLVLQAHDDGNLWVTANEAVSMCFEKQAEAEVAE